MSIGAAGGLWYNIVGSGADTVVVTLGTYLQAPLTVLARNHVVVFYDPRRRGRSDFFSDTTLSTFDADVADLEALRAELRLSRMSVIGFSYYGAVAAAYAALHPSSIARLVLLSPIEPHDSLAAAYMPTERTTRIDTTQARALLKMRAAGRDTTDPSGYCEAYWRLNASLFVGEASRASRIDPAWCRLATESPRAMADQVSRALSSLGPAADFSALARRVTAPALVVYGDRDLVVNPAGAQIWARTLPNARPFPLRGAGHFVFLEESEAVVRAIDRFLRGETP